MRSESPTPPFAVDGPTIGMEVLSPGHRASLRYSLPRGTYVLLCNEPVRGATGETAVGFREGMGYEIARLAKWAKLMGLGAPTGVDVKGKRDRCLGPIDVGDGIDVGKGVAVVTEAIGDRLGRFREFFPRECIAFLQLQEFAQLRLGHDQASGGSLPVERWNELLREMGFE